MKRGISAIALLTLVVFAAACATTPADPAVRGTITSLEGSSMVVTPTGGGQPVTVNLGFGTQVYWASGVEASGTSVLTTGQAVQVWTKGDVATRVVLAQ
ncbi:MAG TPA: hypothetical protein VEO54_29360 [Thermoanaerobaculia bacterium]|nr:hypothetical protein [Thermoanaerobaculia bacterium]